MGLTDWNYGMEHPCPNVAECFVSPGRTCTVPWNDADGPHPCQFGTEFEEFWRNGRSPLILCKGCALRLGFTWEPR